MLLEAACEINGDAGKDPCTPPPKKTPKKIHCHSGAKDAVYSRTRDKATSACVEDAATIMTRVSLLGKVSLTYDGAGNTLLMHADTRQKHLLTGRGWEFIMDDDEDPSRVVLIDEVTDTTKTLDIDVCLTKHLFENESTTERLIIEKNADGHEVKRYSYDDSMIRSRLGKALLQSGALPSESELDTAVFHFARANGFKCFWNLLKLYTLLGLKSYKAKPSMWVWKQAEAWGRAFTAVFGADQIVLSSFETTQTERKHKLYAAEKCLPWPGISTGGLLLMLSRWCLLKPASGGLKEVPSRAAARALLDAFLSCAGHTSCSFQIDFDGDALLSWPVPPLLQYTCTLYISLSG